MFSIELCPIFLLLCTTFVLNSAAIISHNSVDVDKDRVDVVKNDFQPPSPYALELFDLLSLADANNDGMVTLREHTAWNVGLKFPEAEAHTQFDEMDKDEDEILTFREYSKWVKKVWTNSKAYIRETFRDADRDMDGKVSRDEYVLWHQSFENTSEDNSALEFKDDDRNEDGVLTVLDFEMSTFLTSADSNDDGVLSLEEYLKRTLRYLPTTTSPRIQRRKEELNFRDIDKNQDGVLSLKELEDAM